MLLGHSKLETTALYTKVATRTIRAVTGPLDQLMALMEGMVGGWGDRQHLADRLDPVGFDVRR